MQRPKLSWPDVKLGSARSPERGLVLAALPDPHDRRELRAILSSTGLTPVIVTTFEELCAELQGREFSVIVTDSELPGGHSWRSVLRATDGGQYIPMIVADRLADESRWETALDSGCYDLISTPLEATELMRVLGLANTRANCRTASTAAGTVGLVYANDTEDRGRR